MLLLQPCFSQKEKFNYSFKEKKTHFFASAAWNASVRGFGLLRSTPQIEQFDQIDPANLLGIDRYALNRDSKSADTWSDYLLYSSVATPLILLSNDTDRFGDMFLMGIQGFFIQDGIVQLTKIVSKRPRPFVYDQGLSVFDQSIDKTATKSFMSGHTATTSYLCFYSARAFAMLHPESKWKTLVWFGAFVVPAATGYARVRAGKHFPTDVMASYIFGGIFGYVFPELYRNDKMELGLGSSGLILKMDF